MIQRPQHAVTIQKIELTEAGDETSLHPVAHREMWVRVLTDGPLDDFSKVIAKLTETHEFQDRIFNKYSHLSPCAFYTDVWEDDDPEHETYGFEQWWVLPEMTHVRNAREAAGQ